VADWPRARTLFGFEDGFHNWGEGGVALLRPSQEIRVAVVGVGYWGSRHVRVLRSTTGVASVIGVDQRFAGKPGSAQLIDCDIPGYADLEDALPLVDAVIIATPPSSHYPLGMQAIAAGKHVLIEKPFAASLGEAKALVAAAEAAGTLLMPGLTFLYNAAVHKLRDVVYGELGNLYYLDCQRLNLGLYQSDVNVVLDLAPHDISIANYILNSSPTTVTAWGSRHVHPEYEDVANMRLDYSDIGVSADIRLSWLSPQKVRKITAVGSKKMAVYDEMAGDDRIRVYDKFAMSPQESSGPLARVAYHFGDVVSPFIDFAEPLAVQDQDFVNCVADGGDPMTNGHHGLAVVEVLECAQLSLREHRPVTVAEVTQARPESALDLALPALDGSVSGAENALAGTQTQAG
jgi:predicted dehydrogenase